MDTHRNFTKKVDIPKIYPPVFQAEANYPHLSGFLSDLRVSEIDGLPSSAPSSDDSPSPEAGPSVPRGHRHQTPSTPSPLQDSDSSPPHNNSDHDIPMDPEDQQSPLSNNHPIASSSIAAESAATGTSRSRSGPPSTRSSRMEVCDDDLIPANLLPLVNSSPPASAPSQASSSWKTVESVWSDQREVYERADPRREFLDGLPQPDGVEDVGQKLAIARLRIEMGMPDDSPEFHSLKMFKLQIEIGLGTNAYAKILHTFPEIDVPPLKVLRRQVREQAGLRAVAYDCCINCCICYAGPFVDNTRCPFCKHPRRNEKDQPYHQFHYVPLAPQLCSLYAGKVSAKAMRYRADNEQDYVFDPHGRITDLYDSELYRQLRGASIYIDGRRVPFKYFTDPRDILLVGMTDGFALWARSKSTAWPLIFVNANLPPSERFKLANILCAGVIPGPNKPKHFDSYTVIVVEELCMLAMGIATYDALNDEMFVLRAFSIYKVGDMPAVAQAWLRAKSQNAKKPCRFCFITAIPYTGRGNHVHYLPIQHPPEFPPSNLDPANLPPRTDAQWRRMARRVDQAPTGVEQKKRAMKYGINGTSIIAKVPGIHFTYSFPFDLLHLLINTFDNYTTYMSCPTFKDFGPGREDYVIRPAIWKGIGSDTKKANATIPSQFGRSIPNIATERFFFTAEAYLVWFTLYAPILLRGRFPQDRYYDHVMKLISIIKRLVQFKTTKIERDKLRADIIVWYNEYEKIFYQYDKDRLPACVLTIHAWLHLVDLMEKSGPLIYYWCWVMERFCGRLSRAITSRRHPYPSLNRRIIEHQSLQILRNTYDLQDRLPNYTRMHDPANMPSLAHPHYKRLTLVHPRTLLRFNSPDLHGLKYRVAACLATRYKKHARVIMPLIPPIFEQWAKVKVKDGDVLYSHLGYARKEEGLRDASFMEYRQRVDIYAHIARRKPKYKWVHFFGQLDRIVVIQIPPNDVLKFKTTRTFFLLDTHICKTEEDRYGFHEYKDLGRREVINATCLRALVGRIFDRDSWVMVRRSTGLIRTDYVSEAEDY